MVNGHSSYMYITMILSNHLSDNALVPIKIQWRLKIILGLLFRDDIISTKLDFRRLIGHADFSRAIIVRMYLPRVC